MFGANSMLGVGKGALLANQTALHVTGENISNVNTDGYSRRSVRFAEGYSIDYTPGQMGTGVRAEEVVRHFNNHIEKQYNERNSDQQRWNELYEELQSVETLFNESKGSGISTSLSNFFKGWSDLTQRADDAATRRSLVDNGVSFVNTVKQVDSDLDNLQQQVDATIAAEVQTANEVIQQIAEINKQINAHDLPGQNNTNNLYDQRATLVRQLSGILDVTTIDNGSGNFCVSTKAGQNLVDGVSHFSLEYTAAQSYYDPAVGSNYDGAIYYSGADNSEYTIEMVNGGTASDAGTATFRVSMDGGETWLTDEDGAIKEYAARGENNSVQVEGLQIYFGDKNDHTQNPTTNLSAGDRFTITPQKSLFWVKNTSTKENITPQVLGNGSVNSARITGGSLSAHFSYRDEYIGGYRDRLDAFSESVIWEVNRKHSQGAGLAKFGYLDGTYSVRHDDTALASNSTGLHFGSKLQSGSSMVYVYNADTGLMKSGAALDFDAAPGQQNFDPNVHSLDDVAAAYNRTFAGAIDASIVNGKLHLEATTGNQFAFGTDTTGLNAALGINTFFSGTNSHNIEINKRVSSDVNLLNAGHVNGAGEANAGDNTIATAIAALQSSEVTISTTQDGTTSQSITDYYNALIGAVGNDTAAAKFNASYSKTLAQELDARQQSVSGVNMDEEMANLVKFQHSYTAAAKIITTADQMIQTLLNLKN
ncbi:MAG: flagellar hook-associated protein FlgK [Desulfovibrio sp.]